MTTLPPKTYTKAELIAIEIQYEEMLEASELISKSGQELVDKAFQIALKAHEGTYRKSGKPYITHPIEVARIVGVEIGLGSTSVSAALLHDVVEDTEWTLEDIEREFDKTMANIVDGLTKIDGLFDKREVTKNAENFKKLLLTLGEDIRVVLVKLADRLHNMRTMEAMPAHKQKRIGDLTLYLYAPIAHRLGLYRIKSELEDLSMKYANRELYYEIKEKLQVTKRSREAYIRNFINPVKRKLEQGDIKNFRIFGRPKHIFSIGNKIRKKQVPFEDIYDLFAIRIVVDVPLEKEREACWNIYSIITSQYTPKVSRLRDWVSSPKSNGYESLHITVMGPQGKWVEVQVRTKRMDEIAEKGVAAHWKYKGGKGDNKFDEWLKAVSESLNNPDSNPIDFLNDFRHNLYENEIYVFTPKGDLRNLRAESSVLDFAFAIHTDVGCKCVGAKIDGRLRPISHKLKNGDQVEIITTKKQHPNEEWLDFTVTSRARTKIKSYLKNEKRKIAEDGKETLERKLRALKLPYNKNIINELVHHFRYQDSLDFHHAIATKTFDLNELKKLQFQGEKIMLQRQGKPIGLENKSYSQTSEEIGASDFGDAEISIFGGFADKVDYSIGRCCSPVAGDDVFGFVTIGKGIRIHRNDCPNAKDLKTRYPYRVASIKWARQSENVLFLAKLSINGIDDVGLVNKITSIISSELKINMRAISLNAKDGIFTGELQVYAKTNKEIKMLTKKLKEVDGIYAVKRLI
ncbi:MAG: RelA/SpoT family protein [Chitinophagales bacterium]